MRCLPSALFAAPLVDRSSLRRTLRFAHGRSARALRMLRRQPHDRRRAPDADAANWVDRFAPAPLRPWLKLGRFDRPSGIWLLMLPGWWGAALAASEQHEAADGTLLLRIAAGAALMRAAGCAFNDIVDRDIDRRVARTAARPVASGAISRRGATAFLVALSLAALLILLTMRAMAVELGVLSLALVAAYPFMKRITWWPQAWLGLTFNWGVLLGYGAVTDVRSPRRGCSTRRGSPGPSATTRSTRARTWRTTRWRG